jgi:hypothetical protein
MKSIDRKTLRELACRWKEIAELPIMAQRKKQWRALKDLRPERPMILVETYPIADFFDAASLTCTDMFLRNVERTMRETIEHFEKVGDDIVIETYFRLAWKIIKTDYGVPLIEHHASDSSGGDLGYSYNFPIKAPEDLTRLKKRQFRVERKYSIECKSVLEDIFGDILPVRIGNYDNFSGSLGYSPFIGNNFIGITMDIFKLMGNENFLYWTYDHPDSLKHMAEYMCNDRIAFFRWMEQENLLDYNTDNQFGGPTSYGYVSSLPSCNSTSKPELKNVWGWAESQETTAISPAMFEELYLPYIAKVGNMFGLTYYGCCEPLTDRFTMISKVLTNLRAVSVSGWNNLYKMADILGKDYVYSRKPTPTYISGMNANWENLKKDMEDTYKATKGQNLEIIFRDLYYISGDNERIRKWVEMTRNIMNF